MIGGIPNASVFPKTPSLIAKDEPKSFIDKLRDQKKERQIAPEAPSSSFTENTAKPLQRPSTTPQVRYGAAPSAVKHDANTGLNTEGLRKYEPPSKPQSVQKLDEARGGHRLDRLEESPSEKNQISGILTRAPRDADETTPADNLKGTERRPSLEMKEAASPPLYEQLKREYVEKQQEKPVGTQLNAEA